MKIYQRETIINKIRPYYDDIKTVKIITGLRKTGKSILLSSIKEEILNSGVNENNIFYLDLSKAGFKKIRSASQLEVMITSLSIPTGITYVFIDNIDKVKNYADCLNELDDYERYSIFIVGPSSSFDPLYLKKNLFMNYKKFLLSPLSFTEYKEMKELYKKKVNEDNNEEFDEYILNGGLPKPLTIKEDNCIEYTFNLLDEIYKKDIKKTYKIRDINLYEAIRDYLINNLGITINYKNIHEYLLSININARKTKINKVLEALSKSMLFNEVEILDIKKNILSQKEKKYYVSDPSFYQVLNASDSIDNEMILENIIYSYFLNQGYEIRSGKIGKESIDFILSKDNIINYVQVCSSIMSNKEVQDLELKPLKKIKDTENKYVLSLDNIYLKKKGINHLNILDLIQGNIKLNG